MISTRRNTIFGDALPRRVHLVGAAGAGMRALGAVLAEAGCQVTGSDVAGAFAAGESAAARAPGDDRAAGNLPQDCELVVHSAAVPAEHVELARARALGACVLNYPQMLGRLMSRRQGVAVAGTHGKSTTAAMTVAILQAAGQDPTALIGAAPLAAASGGRLGRGPRLVAEACEYREHFRHLRPGLAAILGIEWDHVECFASLDEVTGAFRRFVAGMPPEGMIVAAADCPRSLGIAAESGRRWESFGFGPGADWRAVEARQQLGRYQFLLEHGGASLGRVCLQVIGRHNVLNALAAAALAWHCGAKAEEIVAALNGFAGLQRRLQFLGEWRKAAWVDDYAHHPTEVTASLAALREAFPGRRLWLVFQPHQAVRTRALLDEFALSLQNADRVIVAEAFLAREPAACPWKVAEELARAAKARGARIAAEHRLPEIGALLARDLRPGDVLVTMGAGDIGNISHGIIHGI